jgi:hypothetical protein
MPRIEFDLSEPNAREILEAHYGVRIPSEYQERYFHTYVSYDKDGNNNNRVIMHIGRYGWRSKDGTDSAVWRMFEMCNLGVVSGITPSSFRLRANLDEFGPYIEFFQVVEPRTRTTTSKSSMLTQNLFGHDDALDHVMMMGRLNLGDDDDNAGSRALSLSKTAAHVQGWSRYEPVRRCGRL